MGRDSHSAEQSLRVLSSRVLLSLWTPGGASTMSAMAPRVLLATFALLVAGLAGAPSAAPSRATLRISVQVVRSCRVTTGGEVRVDCGLRPELVRVQQDGHTVTDHLVLGSTPVAPSSATVVTIHF